ncbi:MAG: hypothetical protein QW505_03040 [Thermoplasmata archaeon]
MWSFGIMKVTSYVSKCWAKAAIEIMLAFLALIFGIQVFNQIPGMARLFDVFWFSYAMLWFGVISLFILAYANIAKSLLTVPTKLSSKDISEKLDKLAEKLSGDWVLADQAILPPPPPPEDVLPKKRNAAIALSVVAVLMIASVFVGNAALGLGSLSGGGGSTPEETFDKFIEKLNQGDFEGASGYTVLSFVMTPEEAGDILRGIFHGEEDFSITVNSRSVMPENQIPAELKNNITSIIEMIEQNFSVEIEGWCVIEFNFTVSIVGHGSQNISGMVPLIKIQGSWYLMFEMGGDGGGPGESPCEDIFEEFIARMNAHDATGALSYTVYSYANSSIQSQVIDSFNSLWASGTFSITVSSYYSKDESEFNQSHEWELRDEIVSWVTSKLGLSVTGFCIIYWEGTITNDSGNFPQSDRMPCVRVVISTGPGTQEERWCLVPREPGNEPSNVEVKVSYQDMGSILNFTVQYITNTSQLSLDDVYLTVAYSDGTLSFDKRQLSTMSPGVPEAGVTYFDMNDLTSLNAGDYFLFDKSLYQLGSWFELTNSDGSHVYCHVYFA